MYYLYIWQFITYFKALFTCQVFRVKTQLLGNPTPISVELTMSTTCNSMLPYMVYIVDNDTITF